MDDNCSSERRSEAMAFGLARKNSGLVTDKYGDQYDVFYPQIGNNWLTFKDLPAGEYELVSLTNYRRRHNGEWKFDVVSFSQYGALTINQV